MYVLHLLFAADGIAAVSCLKILTSSLTLASDCAKYINPSHRSAAVFHVSICYFLGSGMQHSCGTVFDVWLMSRRYSQCLYYNGGWKKSTSIIFAIVVLVAAGGLEAAFVFSAKVSPISRFIF